MPNKYLEKISSWKEIDEGLYYSKANGGQYATSKSTSEKFINQHDTRHRLQAAGTMAGVGAATGAIMGAGNLLRNPKRVGKVAAGFGVAGALAGLAIGHAGAKQVDRRNKVNQGIERRLSQIGTGHRYE